MRFRFLCLLARGGTQLDYRRTDAVVHSVLVIIFAVSTYLSYACESPKLFGFVQRSFGACNSSEGARDVLRVLGDAHGKTLLPGYSLSYIPYARALARKLWPW